MVIRPFRFLGGALCLDFINTAGAWTGGNPVRDKFTGLGDLKRWGEAAQILPPNTRLSPKIFARAIILRRSLHAIFQAATEQRAPADRDLAILNRELAIARSRERIRYKEGSFLFHSEESPEQVLWAVARSAAELLTSENVTRVRQCGGPECGWMFLDTSRNRSRQWCDMRICGNRVKARNFRQRSQRKTYSRKSSR